MVAKASGQSTREVVQRQDEFFQVSQVDDRVRESTREMVGTQVQVAQGSHATEVIGQSTVQLVAFEETK